MKHNFLDLYREGTSPVHRLDGRAKLLVTAAFIVCASLLPAVHWPAYLGMAALALAAVVISEVPLRVALARSLVALPFALVAAASLPFLRPGTPLFTLAVGRWRATATDAGLLALGAVLARSWLSVLAAGLLTATTPFTDLLAALQGLGLPRLLAALMSFMYRYVFVLADEAERLARARTARSGVALCLASAGDDAGGLPALHARAGGSLAWRAHVLGGMIGNLFVRSYERSERIYQAMLARGFDGQIRRLPTAAAGGAGAKAASPGGEAEPRVHPAATHLGQAGCGEIVEIEGLSFSYPDGREVLHQVSFRMAEGERVALVGPNGAGKSTLLLHLNGILRGSGCIRVDGLELSERTLAQVRGLVGLVFQDPDDQLFSPSVYEDVAFGPLYMGLEEREVRTRVARALVAVGAAGYERRMPHHMSLGERKRVAIATVLAMQARVLALDEPSSGLDPRGRRALIELLRGLPQTMLVASHDMLLVRDLCPRTIILDGGRIVADGPTPELLADEALLKAHGLEMP